MVDFVLFLQATQNRYRGFHRRFTNDDFLETTLQRGIFFNVLAVFVQGGRAHAMQLTARQSRLEHIASVHRTFGLARTDHGVQLVDKDNRLAFVFGQFAQHRFQALFKLTAKLRAGQQRRHVQRQDALAFERIWHFARHDALRQTFDDSGFANTGFTD